METKNHAHLAAIKKQLTAAGYKLS